MHRFLANIINKIVFQAVATILLTIPEKYLPLPHRSFIEILMGPLSGEKFIRKGVTVHDILFGVRLNFIYDIVLNLVELILGDYITLPPELQNVGGRGWQFGPFVNVSLCTILEIQY